MSSPLQHLVWRCHKFAWTNCGKSFALRRLTADTFPHSFQTPGENTGSHMTRRCKRILEFPLSASISLQQPGGQKYFPRPPANTFHCGITLACRCAEMQKGPTADGDPAQFLSVPST
jgi:hypothetical protein